SDYEKLSHDGFPLSDQSSSDPTSSRKPGFKPSHQPVKQDMGALLQSQNASKSILPQYAKTSSSEQIKKGVEKTLEKAFISGSHKEGGEKTVFFTSLAAQNLNKVSFVKGSAKTTLLKEYEGLAKQIGEIESQLNEPDQEHAKSKSELKQELKTLKTKQAHFGKQVEAFNQLALDYEKLVETKASPQKIEEAKNELTQAQQELLAQLGDLTSDVNLLGSETQVKKGAKQQNRLIFVMSPSGEFYAMDQSKRDIQLPDGHTVISEAKLHHTSMLNGKDVGGGGELRVGSQFGDLHQEIDLNEKSFVEDFHAAPQRLTDTLKQIQHNAETGVERRFVETFKSREITGINQQIQQLESQNPLGQNDTEQLSVLKSQRTELLNEGFLQASTPPTPLQQQYAKAKAEEFLAFKQQELPQILHNVLEAQFPKGQVEILSDQSGHYQPNLSFTGKAITGLEKQGVEVEKLTVSLGGKGYGQSELRMPATGVQGFADFGHGEDQLRKFDQSKKTMHQDLLKNIGSLKPVKSSDSGKSRPLSDSDHEKLKVGSQDEQESQEHEYEKPDLKPTPEDHEYEKPNLKPTPEDHDYEKLSSDGLPQEHDYEKLTKKELLPEDESESQEHDYETPNFDGPPRDSQQHGYLKTDLPTPPDSSFDSDYEKLNLNDQPPESDYRQSPV
ncbi:MAG: hypothetical protein ACAI44_31040, partial [Candidatus Sericytochromatia bacterium]